DRLFERGDVGDARRLVEAVRAEARAEAGGPGERVSRVVVVDTHLAGPLLGDHDVQAVAAVEVGQEQLGRGTAGRQRGPGGEGAVGPLEGDGEGAAEVRGGHEVVAAVAVEVGGGHADRQRAGGDQFPAAGRPGPVDGVEGDVVAAGFGGGHAP